jgi:hypothetical protein
MPPPPPPPLLLLLASSELSPLVVTESLSPRFVKLRQYNTESVVRNSNKGSGLLGVLQQLHRRSVLYQKFVLNISSHQKLSV